MANEIKLTARAIVQNGNYYSVFQPPGNTSYDQAAVGAVSGIATVGTTAEALSFGDVATLGYAFLQNLDEDNFITFGPDSTGSLVPFGKLKPGEVAMLRLVPGITFKWQADTAACKVSYLVLED